MSKKFYYLDASGFVTESEAFESVDFTNVGGIGSANKPVLLDATGKLDSSMINFGAIDHGGLSGLGDDDHTIYIKADGTRAFTGNQSLGGFKITSLANGTTTNDAVNYGQLQAVVSQIANLEFQDSVIDRVTVNPGSPSTGDRYLVIATATGAFAGQENKIAEFNGTSWDFITPTTGMFVSVDDENDKLYYFNGSAWVEKYFEATTASLGAVKVGMDIRLDYVPGGGIKLVGNQAAIEPNDFAGNGLIDDGSDNLAIDWATIFTIDSADAKALRASDLASTSAGLGASIVGVQDANGYFLANNQEDVNDELYMLIKEFGNKYTVGTGGVTKGDLLYISANNTVLPYDDITIGNRGIGLALTTEIATSQVVVLANDTILTGVLSGATAGTVYYWDGSTLVSTIPNTSGQYVWRVGVAKNATDLHVEVEFVKKNA